MKRILSICTFFFFKIFAQEAISVPTLQDYSVALETALQEERWWDAIDYADIVAKKYPTTPLAEESHFQMGEAYLELAAPFHANQAFSEYLHHSHSPHHFEKAIEYKFSIAEAFRKGEKKPLFGSHKMPKWMPAQEDAVEIYDEVVTALPHSEMAVQSLMGKAQLQRDLEDYKPSIETLDHLLRRFPKHDLAAAAFLEKIHVYFLQCQGKNLDLDLLDLARITQKKFRLSFPREPRLQEGEKFLRDMEEIFAKNLLTTGQFFEKTKKFPAASLYYQKVTATYPNTDSAQVARENLLRLSPPPAQ